MNEPIAQSMHDIAVLLNDGRRRGAWKNFASQLGVAPFTVRRWYSKNGDLPPLAKRLVVALIKIKRLEKRLVEMDVLLGRQSQENQK